MRFKDLMMEVTAGDSEASSEAFVVAGDGKNGLIDFNPTEVLVEHVPFVPFDCGPMMWIQNSGSSMSRDQCVRATICLYGFSGVRKLLLTSPSGGPDVDIDPSRNTDKLAMASISTCCSGEGSSS